MRPQDEEGVMSTSSSLAADAGAFFEDTYTECFDVLSSNSLVSSERNCIQNKADERCEQSCNRLEEIVKVRVS